MPYQIKTNDDLSQIIALFDTSLTRTVIEMWYFEGRNSLNIVYTVYGDSTEYTLVIYDSGVIETILSDWMIIAFLEGQ